MNLRSSTRIVFLVALVACSKTEPPRTDPAPVSATASVQDPRTGSSAAAPSDAGAPARGAALAYTADFDAEVAPLTLPEDVKWKGDSPETEGVGKGKLALSVDADGRVSGTGSGAFGDVVVAGISRDGVMSGSILRKTTDDAGFSGVFVATESGGAWKGSLAVSKGNAGGLRRASFTLVKR